jgi:hypothetical protein
LLLFAAWAGACSPAPTRPPASADAGTPTADATAVLDAGAPAMDQDAGATSADAAAPPDAAVATDAGAAFFGTDCPPAAPPSSLPAGSPRILILGPSLHGAFARFEKPRADIPAMPPTLPDAHAIAAHLEGMLTADPAFGAPVVTATTIERTSTVAGGGGTSLMNFFYLPGGRAARLAPLAEPASYVVLLDELFDPANRNASAEALYPEIYFEGVRVLGCLARAAGAKPVVLMPLSPAGDAAMRAPLSYRVANGTGSILSPGGIAWDAVGAEPADWPAQGPFVAAATLYSTLTGRNAADGTYSPPGIDAGRAAMLARVAFETVESEAGKVHYQDPWRGVMEVRTATAPDLWFMDSGSSSEQLWFDRMNEILPKAGLAPHGTQIGYTNPYKIFDAAALQTALPYFRQQQYSVLFARGYYLSAGSITATGAQTKLQVQVWDRHDDSDPSDGIAAVGRLEPRFTDLLAQARGLGLVAIPYHLMFSKLKTMRPAVPLLSDGTHATYTVAYGLATMSAVSRSGRSFPTDGLDSNTRLAAQLADETIRQLSALSASGVFVADDPNTRPRP